ncbi:MAG: single-strand binding protein [Solirubrobacterales bacterium]|nr:single-strand binding protein [Solirubrobacterales bacterium]
MYSDDTNITVHTGNLTRDVETRKSPGGIMVANIRIGVNGRRKVGDEWVDKPNFFTVVTFGKQAENDAKYLKKGRRILVEGRLDWSEYEKDGDKRQAVQIIANRVKYLPSKASIEDQAASDGQTEMSTGEETQPAPVGEPADVPAPSEQPVGAGAGGKEDDIPF